MSQAKERWKLRPPSNKVFYKRLEEWLQQLAKHGTCNVLMSDSRALYAFCTTHLSMLTRRAPFSEASLIDTDLIVNFKEVTTSSDVVTVLATHPLTEGEGWQSLEQGVLHVFSDGEKIK